MPKCMTNEAGLDPRLWLRICDVLLLMAQVAGELVRAAIEGCHAALEDRKLT